MYSLIPLHLFFLRQDLLLKLEITDFSRLDGSKSWDSPVSASSEPGL